MSKFLIVDSRVAYSQDMNTRIDIEDYRDIEAEAMLYSNYESFQQKIIQTHYDVVVISNVIFDMPDFKLPTNIKILGYLEKKEDSEESFKKNNIKCLGFFKKSGYMLDGLEEIDLNDDPVNHTEDATPSEDDSKNTANIKQSEKAETAITEQLSNDNDDKSVSDIGESFKFCVNCGNKISSSIKFCPHCGHRNESETPSDSFSDIIRNNAIERDEAPEETVKLVERDISRNKHKCKIITVYAAKGGVGKTTISTSIAVLLAMTSTDRRRTKVCIVDYNIDFGDVRPTLGFSSKGVNLMTWASDIDARVEEGEEPEDINYTQEEIETRFLQKKTFNKILYGQNVELYGLIAPIIHEDSMEVSGNAIDVMIRNLRDNGDFDYIICDTGNNTRDSTFTALEIADKVLLINTQDVTTVSCNDSFLKTMENFEEFDVNKINLVINNIVPAKETGVSVKDIEETVPFTCIARIRHNTGVILANNKGVPLVFDSGTQFTKEISNIISVITDEGLKVNTKKKGLLSIFKK